MGPDPAVAAVRLAVRRALAGLPADALVLVACSGGADSLALAGALAFEATRAGRPAGAVTVDHGLQEGSARRADELVRTLRDLGLDPVGSVAVTVDGDGGPENAARDARYAALDATAARLRATILLGHTRNDQAETVLLGLARGSGARSLAGMPQTFTRTPKPTPRTTTHTSTPETATEPRTPEGASRSTTSESGSRSTTSEGGGRSAMSEGGSWPGPSEGGGRSGTSESGSRSGAPEGANGSAMSEDFSWSGAPEGGAGSRAPEGVRPVRYVRPLLEIDRVTTRRACRAMGLEAWDDPHNEDPAYTRVRLRHEALPALEKALGPGVMEALARTARLLRDDVEALDEWADRVFVAARMEAPGARVGLDVAALVEVPRGVRTRVLRRAAVAAGSPAGTLAAVHVDAVDRLVMEWRGQRHVDLPGGLRAYRRYEKLLFGEAEPVI